MPNDDAALVESWRPAFAALYARDAQNARRQPFDVEIEVQFAGCADSPRHEIAGGMREVTVQLTTARMSPASSAPRATTARASPASHGRQKSCR